MARPTLNIGFVGSGGVNFGSLEGPWDHASRIEKLDFVRVVGIADPDTTRAHQVLEIRQKGPHPTVWETTKIFDNFNDLLKFEGIDAVIIGLPPNCHGYSNPPFNIESVGAELGISMFIEKPLSAAPPEELEITLERIKKAQEEKNLVVSVGYMFRYSKAIEKMKEIIRDEALLRREKLGLPRQNEDGLDNHVTVINARFNCAYSEINKTSWWHLDASGGPIVEQSTHLVDIARYIAESEPILDTVKAHTIESSHPQLGQLADLPVAYGSKTNQNVEANIPAEKRIPRATTAIWQFESGALCSLTHGVALHGSNIEADLQVWSDGTRFTIENLYKECRLTVRRSSLRGSSEVGQRGEDIETYDFGGYREVCPNLDADPYMNELKAFLEACRLRKEGKKVDQTLVRSPYGDALKTYDLTWKIRRVAEAK
eukprot:TRINITY_DN13249_c0_g1_i1.p1 TRINITY_DN13249_c0_g1~~TRINITY_DN13249_c0_g1_i1.p1  ORF type:complete len:428 (-),score=81.58 TRINITY_DN13249_c0_g1_i1:55-1338(-)